MLPKIVRDKGITNLLSLDFETYYDKDYTLKKMATTLYIMDERFKVHGVAVKFNNEQTKYLYDPIDIEEYFNDIDWEHTAMLAHHCVPGDTEVLTKFGWKPIKETTQTQQIMQWNPDTNEATWIQPLSKTETTTDYIYEWDSLYHKGAYTSKHRIYYHTPSSRQWRSKTCKEIQTMEPNNIYLPKAGLHQGTIHLEKEAIQLLEAIRADGSIVKNSIAVRFKFKKQRKIKRLLTILDKLKLSYHKAEDKHNCTIIYIHKCKLLKTLFSFFIVNSSIYNNKILDLSLSNKETLIKELIHWDGHSPKKYKNKISVSSIDKQSLEILQTTAHLINWTANFTTTGYNNWRSNKPLYTLLLRKTNRCKLQYKPNKLKYKDKVYCFTVPTGAFFIRRKGVINITGNCHFDSLILTRHYKHKPAWYLDTLSMARPLYMNVLKSLSLDSLAKHLEIGGKIEGLEDTKGKRDLTDEEQQRLGIYAINDVDIMYECYIKMLPLIVDFEYDIIDWHIRMYAEGAFIIDNELAEQEIKDIEARKKEMFARVRDLFPPELKDSDASTLTILRSAEKYAEVLRHNGIEPPKKVSKTTGKQTYAFAKNDVAFMAFETKGEIPALLFKARVESKSDTALNKAKMLLEFGKYPPFPLYVNYWKATTGRSTGSDKLQAQNMTRGGNARKALTAPKDYVVMSVDSSGIEMRIAIWFARQMDKVQIVNEGGDLYVDMANNIYDFEVTKKNKEERGIGKVTILSCQYGSSCARFDDMLKSGAMAPPIHLPYQQVEHIHAAYRKTYNKVVAAWGLCNNFLYAMANNNAYKSPDYMGVKFEEGKAITHHGMYLNYYDLKHDGQGNFTYQGANGVRKKIYSSLLFNNLCQHIARNVVYYQINLVKKELTPRHVVHDETSVIVHKDVFKETEQFLLECFSTAPPYIDDIKLSSEVEYAFNDKGVSYYAK